jgi:2-hydroxychromene-2-carboxylate isomerase
MKDTNLVLPRKRLYISCLSKTKILNNKLLKNKIIAPALLAISSVAIGSTTLAATPAPVEFTSQDWQVVCDNTRTCRLAGYQAENNSEFPVSVLLVRRAGANASVEGKVKLGGAKENSSKALMQLGNRHRISLFINDKNLGETKPFSAAAGDAELTETQVTALLDALTKSSKIELVLRNSRWQLSDRGATAVMLKADEAQGRIGTSSAFIDNESISKSNNSVLAAEPAPLLRSVLPDVRPTSRSNKNFSIKASQLSALLQRSMKDASNDCPNLSDSSPWRVSRLNSTQLLAQHSCWTGAYNAGTGVWVLNDSKPYKPTLITTSATDYSKGKISSVQKGRGIGDCLSKTDWLWTDNRFAKSHESTTGLCRLIEVGGAWQLPTYVTEVKTSR